MPEFKKFDPYAWLGERRNPPKAPKAAKGGTTLGTLGGLAGRFRSTSKGFVAAPNVWGEADEERAAIIEYDGGVPRAWAEALARLDNNVAPPADVTPARWLQFVTDCGRFLDGGWAATAHALGWTPLDLFGCDRCHGSQLDRSGLLWRIEGSRLVALSANTAVIEVTDGKRQKFARLNARAEVVFAWQLVS